MKGSKLIRKALRSLLQDFKARNPVKSQEEWQEDQGRNKNARGTSPASCRKVLLAFLLSLPRAPCQSISMPHARVSFDTHEKSLDSTLGRDGIVMNWCHVC